MNKKIDLDLNILHKVSELSADLKAYKQKYAREEVRSVPVDRSPPDQPNE